MSKSKKYIIYAETFKYPYCGNNIESAEFLSEKFCCYTIITRKKIIKKAKWLIVYGDFILRLSNGAVPSQAIGLPISSQTPPIMRSSYSNVGLSKKAIIAKVIQQMPAEIDFTESEMNELYHLSVECKINSLSQEELITKISNLRGGSFIDIAAALGLIGGIIILLTNDWSLAFQPNPNAIIPPHLQWLYGNNFEYGRGAGPSPSRPTTVLEMEKPALMPQQEYSGMTKSERRQLACPEGRDGFIEVDGYPRLDLRYNQVVYKTPKHGKDHGLPVDNNGKTPKTEANAIGLRDSLIDMSNNQNIVWYTNGQYQGGTPRGCDSINLFDPDRNLITVYQKQPDGSYLFLTTCKLVPAEVKHLMATNGNFVTKRVLKEQKAVSTFVIDGMGITPISPMDEDSPPNPGFTPTNSFESDVMGITSIDNPQSNNP